jgi:malonyl CoA-acyl carrier protein transacylase
MHASLPARLLLGARRSSSAALPTAKAAAATPSRCLLFPGQGSQHVGMGRCLAHRFAAARLVFEEVDAALGVSLSRRMFDPATDAAHLASTEFAQPAILAHSVAAWRALQHELGGGRAHAFPINAFATALLGHSLGEYSALVVGESVSLWDAARLVRARGLAMQAACSVPGEQYAMAALARAPQSVARPGAPSSPSDRPCNAARNSAGSNNHADADADTDFAESIRRVCVDTIASDHELRSRQRVVGAANVNTRAQVVISGHRDAVLTAIERAKAAGLVRRATFLNVSAPFHCSLMRPAADVYVPSFVLLAHSCHYFTGFD